MELVKRLKSLIACVLSICILASPVSAQEDRPPALRTELSEKGVSLKPVMFSPTRGLMTNITEVGRSEQVAAVLDNLHMFKRGVWTSRGGGCEDLMESHFPTTEVPGFPTVYTRVWNLVAGLDEDLEDILVVHAGDTIYRFEDRMINGASLMDGTPAAVSEDHLSDMKSFDKQTFIFVNGDEEVPLFWDGDPTHGFDPLHGTGKPNINGVEYDKPKYIENFAGRLVTAGYENEPYTVVFSQQGDVDNYGAPSGLSTDCGTISFPSSLGAITGMHTMRLDSTTAQTALIVGMERGMGIVTGSDALDFTSIVLTEEFGLMSHRSFVTIGNDMYFMATDGIRRISSSVGQSVIALVALTYGIQDLINRINKEEKSKIFAIHHPKTQEALWFIPIDENTESENAIVMNYNVEPTVSAILPTSVNAPIFSTMSGLEVTCGGTIRDVCYIGTAQSTVKELYSGDDYDGQHIDWAYVSPLIGGNSPVQNCSIRRIDVLTDGPNQSFTIEAYTLSQQASGNTGVYLQDQKTYSVTAASITDLSTWTSGTTTSYPKFIEFQPKGSGRYWQIRVKGLGGQHISFAGLMAVLTLGGWKQ